MNHEENFDALWADLKASLTEQRTNGPRPIRCSTDPWRMEARIDVGTPKPSAIQGDPEWSMLHISKPMASMACQVTREDLIALAALCLAAAAIFKKLEHK